MEFITIEIDCEKDNCGNCKYHPIKHPVTHCPFTPNNNTSDNVSWFHNKKRLPECIANSIDPSCHDL